MNKKRGRPKEIDSRSNAYRLRMNKEEKFFLEKFCENEHMTKATALRMLIKIGYDLSKKGAFIGYTKNEEDDNLITMYPIIQGNEEENW